MLKTFADNFLNIATMELFFSLFVSCFVPSCRAVACCLLCYFFFLRRALAILWFDCFCVVRFVISSLNCLFRFVPVFACFHLVFRAACRAVSSYRDYAFSYCSVLLFVLTKTVRDFLFAALVCLLIQKKSPRRFVLLWRYEGRYLRFCLLIFSR